MSYPSIIVLKYALSSGPFLVIPGQRFGKRECDAIVQIYKKGNHSQSWGYNLLELQGLDQLPQECGLRVDHQLNDLCSSYFYNTKNTLEFVLNNPQGRDLAYKVIDNLELKKIKKFCNQLSEGSQNHFDSIQPLHLEKAETARKIIRLLSQGF